MIREMRWLQKSCELSSSLRASRVSCPSTSIGEPSTRRREWMFRGCSSRQFSGGTTYNLTEYVFLQSDMSRQGAFYFDDSHNQKSTPFSLLNVSAGIRRSSWSWTIWWKNVLNENYPVRGFYFGNEPPDFPNKKYVQRGDPSFFGTTLTYSF